MPPSTPPPHPETANLRALVQRLERGAVASVARVVGVGAWRIDAALPWGGLPMAAVHEVLAQPNPAASLGFALVLAGRACRQGGGPVLLVALDRSGLPYGPGVAQFGLMPQHLLLARVPDRRSLLWVLEEALRCPALSTVIGVGVETDLTAARRLQLAAEAGGTLGLLLPGPRSAVRSAARTRWRVVPQPEQSWTLHLERCQGGQSGQWLVRWDAATQSFAEIDPAPPLRGAA